MSDEMRVIEIPLSEIDADEDFNCRGRIEPLSCTSLAEDINRDGLLQPVTVGPSVKEDYKYRLIIGFRRFCAHQILQKKTIRAIYDPKYASEIAAKSANIRENLHRKDLSIMDEARTLKSLFDMGMTEAQVMEATGQKRGYVQVRGMLLKLPKEMQEFASTKSMLTAEEVRDLYSVLKNESEDACFAIFRDLKDSKLHPPTGKKRGPKVKIKTIRARKEKPETMKERSLLDVASMNKHIYDTIGPNILTRLCAWIGGHITDIDWYESLQQYALSQGKTYVIPIRENVETITSTVNEDLFDDEDDEE